MEKMNKLFGNATHYLSISSTGSWGNVKGPARG